MLLTIRTIERCQAQKLFTLSRYGREDMWRRFKQTDDRRVAERLHAILLLDSGQNADAVSVILHIHPKTLKRWIKAFVNGGEDALTTLKYVGGDEWMTDEQQQQFTSWLDSDARSTAEAISWVEQQYGLNYSVVAKLRQSLRFGEQCTCGAICTGHN